MYKLNRYSLDEMIGRCNALSEKFNKELVVVRHNGCAHFSIENPDIVEYGKSVWYYTATPNTH